MQVNYNSSKLKIYNICPLKYKYSFHSNILNRDNKIEQIKLFIHNKVHEVIYNYLKNYQTTPDIALLEKILKNNWDHNLFHDIVEERNTGLEILTLLKNFAEIFFVYGSTLFLQHQFTFELQNFNYSGIIEHLVETLTNSYTLIIYNIGKEPDKIEKIYNDYKIILQLIYLHTIHNIIPDKIIIYYLKSNTVKEIKITEKNISILNNGIKNIIELTYKILNDNIFLPTKSSHCNICEYIMLCPTGKEKNRLNEYSKIINNYFKINEYSNQLNKYTFSLKNLIIEFNKIMTETENYSDIKYIILHDNIREFISDNINNNDIYNSDKTDDILNSNLTNIIVDNQKAYVNTIELNDKPSIIQLIFSANNFEINDNKFLITLCRFFNSTFQNAYNFKKSITDHLTKLYNNGYYNLKLLDEKEIALKYNKSLGLIVTDIDHFKNFNDTYGHLIGDLVLVEVAKILKISVSTADWVFRYGGEEFTIIVPNKNLLETARIAENIRLNIENHKVKHKDYILSVTMSFGVAVYPENTDNIELLFKKADDKLYESKKTGRNKVTY